VSKPQEEGVTPGASVATGTTSDDGSYRLAVEPGNYVVTAEAGMSCKPVSVTVSTAEYVSADLICDTGIR
jgi:hypothetical protein